MTVVNIHVAEDAIHCLTDTLAYVGDAPAGLIGTKCNVIGSVGAMACRGRVQVSRMLAEMFEDVGAFDAFVRDLPIMLREYDAAGLIDGDGHEATVMGFSPERGRLVAVFAKLDGDTRAVTVSERGPGWHLAPDLGVARIVDRLPAAFGRTVAERLALAQWKLSTTAGWGFCIGGAMTITTITPAGITQEIVGTYPDYAAHRDRFGDPNADVVALLRRAAA